MDDVATIVVFLTVHHNKHISSRTRTHPTAMHDSICAPARLLAGHAGEHAVHSTRHSIVQAIERTAVAAEQTLKGAASQSGRITRRSLQARKQDTAHLNVQNHRLANRYRRIAQRVYWAKALTQS